MNPRGFELILKNNETQVKTKINLLISRQPPYDPRYWFAGDTTTIDTTITLPEMVEGSYSILLSLPDTHTTATVGRSLYERPNTLFG